MAAAAPGRSRCVTCRKDNKATSRCGGCLQEFCFKHLLDHRQELNKQLHEIEVTRDLFRQTLSQQTEEPQRHALIQQINDWERKSIEIIQRTANEVRQMLLEHTGGYVKRIEVDLNKLTDELRQNRIDDDFFETDLHQWKEELKRLAKELAQPSNVQLRHDNTALINKISVVTGAGKSIRRI